MPRAIPNSDQQMPVVTTARSDAATAPGTMTTTVARALARALTGASTSPVGTRSFGPPAGESARPPTLSPRSDAWYHLSLIHI